MLGDVLRTRPDGTLEGPGLFNLNDIGNTPRTRQQTTEAGRRSTVLFALVVCLIVFFSEEASHKEVLEQRRLRGNLSRGSSVTVPSEVALEVFQQRVNGTITETVSIVNVFVGKFTVPSGAIPAVSDSAFDIQELAMSEDPFKDDNELLKIMAVYPEVKQKSSLKSSSDVSPVTNNLTSITEPIPSGEETAEEDHSLRWNVEKSSETSLEGAFKVKGMLWAKPGPVPFEGIHLSRQGRMTLFTKDASETHDKTFGLLTPLPETLLTLTSANGTVNPQRNTSMLRGSFGGLQGLAFGEPARYSTESHNDDGENSPELFPGCFHPIRFDLRVVHAVASEQSEGVRNVKALSFSGRGTCRNSSLTFVVPPTASLVLDVEYAVRSASFLSLYGIVETFRLGHTLTFLGPLRHGVLADMGPLSLVAFGWIALTDMYLCELLMNASGSVGGEGWWMTAAISKGCIFLFSHIPLLVLIFFGRSRMNGEPNETVVRNLSSCMSRAQFAWLISMVLFEFVRQKSPRMFALIWVSFWIPQVYCTATLNRPLPVALKDVLGLTALRAIWPILALSTHILDTLAQVDRYGSHTDAQIYDPVGVVIVIAYVSAQVFVIYLQGKYGPQFFVPKFLLPKKFDYHAGKEEFKAEEECVVCMQTISKEELVVTPCRHAFHEQCLEPWLQMKRTCPTCRASIPAMN